MRSKNQYVVGLALTTLGNIGSVRTLVTRTRLVVCVNCWFLVILLFQMEMIRDLAAELELCLQNPNAYVQKKVCVCVACVCVCVCVCVWRVPASSSFHKGVCVSLSHTQAALCAIRVFNKVPDMIPDFLPKIAGLLSDKSHSVLLTGLTLMVEVCNISPTLIPRFSKVCNTP
jgi:hypothetical protein